MCTVAGAASVLSTGLSVAGSVVSHNEQKKNAYNQWLFNVQKEVQEEKYRGQLIEYQNKSYDQDIKHGFNVLEYQQNEFDRQKQTIDRATENIEKNRFAQYGQLLLRQVQENIASTLGMDDVRRQARKISASGEAAAASKGIEGITVDQIIGDIARQEGEALTIMDLNEDNMMQQMDLEMQGVKATADQRIFDMAMGTYSPSASIRSPQPISPSAPAAPVPMPSGGALAINIGTSLVSGVSNFSKWSGQSLNNLKI